MPTNSQAIAHPFMGWVVNFNVITRGHRDDKDQGFCLVIPIGSFTKGDLCFYESGFVIPLQNGDAVVFASPKITHFNMHFIGERASLVFHTDVDMKKFDDHSNHWGDNTFFQG